LANYVPKAWIIAPYVWPRGVRPKARDGYSFSLVQVQIAPSSSYSFRYAVLIAEHHRPIILIEAHGMDLNQQCFGRKLKLETLTLLQCLTSKFHTQRLSPFIIIEVR
jgi:hypothetical protein